MAYTKPEAPALQQTPPSNVLPDSKQSLRLKYPQLGFHHLVTHGMYLFLIPLAAAAAAAAHLSTLILQDPLQFRGSPRDNLVSAILCSAVLSFVSSLYILTRPRPVYLVDFSCFKPDDSRKCSRERFMELGRLSGWYSEESLQFQRKIMERSGISDRTYVPESVNRIPVNVSIAEARKEAGEVIFGALDELFAQTNVKPRDVDIIIVNGGTFNPTPSLSAMIVNRYKLRENILSYNLGGMGCSASVIAVDLARDLLQAHPNSYAVVVSTENITRNLYLGNERSMLLSNCLFRMGGAAILLSNRRSDRRRSRYQLVHTVRTHTGADDKAYGCCNQREDDEGKVGVSLSKDMAAIAGETLKVNITTLAPLMLPMSKRLRFLATLVGKSLFHIKIMPYVPDFKLGIHHFCVHAGGRAILNEMAKNLQLSEWHLEPSRMTLYMFGNTSSSCIWYELAYMEAKGRVKRGDRVWQIALGAGFKCNSAVWKALRTVNPAKLKNPWMDVIDQLPVPIPMISEF